MLTVKEGDTHDVTFTLTDRVTGDPVSLTGVTATMLVSSRAGVVTELDVTVVGDPALGVLTHGLTGTLAPGTYSGVIKLEKDGIQTTAPTESLELIKVTPNLEVPATP